MLSFFFGKNFTIFSLRKTENFLKEKEKKIVPKVGNFSKILIFFYLI